MSCMSCDVCEKGVGFLIGHLFCKVGQARSFLSLSWVYARDRAFALGFWFDIYLMYEYAKKRVSIILYL